MSVFENSKWIYASCVKGVDQYTEYVDILKGVAEKAVINLSCDTDYTLYINEEYVASGQYGDFTHYKIYDSIDITSFLRKGNNIIKLLVYYCGVDTQRYKKADAGLIYEVIADGKTVCTSDENTLSRLSPTYINGNMRYVSRQLGFTFSYDATKENEGGYSPSVPVHKDVELYPRPIKKQEVLPRQKIKEIKKEPWGYLIDLGCEVVGFATLDIMSKGENQLCITYGESLDNGRVRAKIHDRSFFFEYKSKDGHNIFTDYMLRLSCRYMEVIADGEIEINYVGILPQVYSVEEKECKIESYLDRQIYDICVNTLRLCMMEHYVDTPWREQCLYAFDSRNQMLCGYYAFEDGNGAYAHSNLTLLSEDRRDDGLLSICAPCGTTLAIPSFSLYYIIAMREYLYYTGDASLMRTYYRKIEKILDEFIGNSDNGLVNKFQGTEKWNFYDWSEHLEGALYGEEGHIPDLVANCLFALALDSYNWMCERVGINYRYGQTADNVRRLIKEKFLHKNGLFTLHADVKQYTVLGNALAVLCGAVKGKDAVKICDSIVKNELTSSSLSMNIWKYEAMMLTDLDRYKNYIIDEIRRNYKKMLDNGSTTVWETIDGSLAFGNAGSLCHGWSAVPVYVYHRLGIARSK
ncbi:MAG: hypothetical protein IJX51_03910 [Clostridia bacterium]|nr:hypothetical protein [Clostridia bacterium]